MRVKKINEEGEKFFASLSLPSVVRSISEWLICFVGMKRKYIPQKHSGADL
jgi:hypothetical protein